MGKIQDLEAMRQQGNAAPATRMSRTDILLLAHQLYGGKSEEMLDFGAVYNTIRDIERLTQKQLDASSTVGTALEPLVEALNARGQEVPQSLGGLIEAGLSTEDIHYPACYCHHGKTVSGQALSDRFVRRAKVGPDYVSSAM